MHPKGIIIFTLIAMITVLFSCGAPEWRKETAPLTEKPKALEAAAEKVRSGDAAAVFKDHPGLLSAMRGQ